MSYRSFVRANSRRLTVSGAILVAAVAVPVGASALAAPGKVGGDAASAEHAAPAAVKTQSSPAAAQPPAQPRKQRKAEKCSLAELQKVRAALHADTAAMTVHQEDSTDLDACVLRVAVGEMTPAVQKFRDRFGARVVVEVVSWEPMAW